MAVDTAAPEAPPQQQRPPAPSPFKQFAEVIEQHIRLAVLESQFELAFLIKRVAAYAASAFLGLTIYVLLHVAILHGLMRAGLPLWGASLVVCAVYGAGIAALILLVGKRDKKGGAPFEASRQEWKRSREWIRKRFF